MCLVASPRRITRARCPEPNPSTSPAVSVRCVPGVRRRLLVVTSSGGVLLDVWALRRWWQRHDTTVVAVDAPDTHELLAGQHVLWADELRPTQVVDVAAATVHAVIALRRERVDLVVSAGSGVAVPWFLAARMCGVSAWWVQTLNVSGSPGLAARVCSRLAARVVVQHPLLLAEHLRSVHVGELY